MLPAGTVAEIQKTTLADIIARNTHTTNLQPNVFFFHASIGGTVFSDGNADSRRQSVERGVAGATVTLLDAAGSTVATTLSDAQGNYRFTGLDLGNFRASVALATPSRLWIKCVIAGCDASRPRKPSAFPAVDVVDCLPSRGPWMAFSTAS